jgi:hypothetical protein
MDTFTTKSTSRNSAVVSDIILRETETTRLIFRPVIVENPHNKKACVRGHFIFQKKKVSGNWEDYNDFSLSKLKDGEWIKLELKAGEVYKLLDEFEKLKKAFEQYGIILGQAQFEVTQGNLENVLLQLSKFENKELIIKTLEKIKPEDLQNLDSIIGVGKFKKAVDFWKSNKNEDDEEFWQKFFKENSWIISQVFSYSAVLFQDKAYVGGKGVDNKGGNVIDFIYQNGLTKNTALVEIKTPAKKLVSILYRGQQKDGVYSIGNELTGAINQVLNYKEELQKQFFALAKNSEKKFDVFNPKSIVIIGSLELEKLENGRLKSFELFRHSNKDVEIITYDELFNKIEIFLSLL